MNILILSASTGGGHMRASKAIENYMIQQGENINVEIVDSLLYISPILRPSGKAMPVHDNHSQLQ